MMFRVGIIKEINVKIIEIIIEITREVKWYLENDDCYLVDDY